MARERSKGHARGGAVLGGAELRQGIGTRVRLSAQVWLSDLGSGSGEVRARVRVGRLCV
jgi:hypothetical protein